MLPKNDQMQADFDTAATMKRIMKELASINTSALTKSEQKSLNKQKKLSKKTFFQAGQRYNYWTDQNKPSYITSSKALIKRLASITAQKPGRFSIVKSYKQLKQAIQPTKNFAVKYEASQWFNDHFVFEKDVDSIYLGVDDGVLEIANPLSFQLMATKMVKTVKSNLSHHIDGKPIDVVSYQLNVNLED